MRAFQRARRQGVIPHAVAFLQQQQVRQRHVSGQDGRPSAQAVAGGTDDGEAVEPDVLGFDVVHRIRQCQQHGVERAGLQSRHQARGLILPQV